MTVAGFTKIVRVSLSNPDYSSEPAFDKLKADSFLI